MDVFECAVCLELLSDPRVISCGHTFCKKCLTGLKPDQRRCPLCQQTFESPDSLPSNWLILKWFEENPHPQKKDPKCDDCDAQLAVVWCEKCEAHYCDSCNANLHSGKASGTHLRMTLKEKMDRPTFVKCKSHLEDNKLYCLDCMNLLCSVCKEDDHQQHKVMSIFKYAETLKSELKSMMSTFNESINYFNGRETDIKTNITRMQSKRDALLKQIGILEEKITKEKCEEELILQQRRKVEAIQNVLLQSIEEMGVTDLMKKDVVQRMKQKIRDIDEELCPGKKEIVLPPLPKLVEAESGSVSLTESARQKDQSGYSLASPTVNAVSSGPKPAKLKAKNAAAGIKQPQPTAVPARPKPKKQKAKPAASLPTVPSPPSTAVVAAAAAAIATAATAAAAQKVAQTHRCSACQVQLLKNNSIQTERKKFDGKCNSCLVG